MAIKSRKRELPETPGQLYEVPGEWSAVPGQPKLSHTEGMKWLDKAAVHVHMDVIIEEEEEEEDESKEEEEEEEEEESMQTHQGQKQQHSEEHPTDTKQSLGKGQSLLKTVTEVEEALQFR